MCYIPKILLWLIKPNLGCLENIMSHFWLTLTLLGIRIHSRFTEGEWSLMAPPKPQQLSIEDMEEGIPLWLGFYRIDTLVCQNGRVRWELRGCQLGCKVAANDCSAIIKRSW